MKTILIPFSPNQSNFYLTLKLERFDLAPFWNVLYFLGEVLFLYATSLMVDMNVSIIHSHGIHRHNLALTSYSSTCSLQHSSWHLTILLQVWLLWWVLKKIWKCKCMETLYRLVWLFASHSSHRKPGWLFK
jgi:hypothetical protein